MEPKEARLGRLEAREPMPTAPEAIKLKEIGARIATLQIACPERSGVAAEANQRRGGNSYEKTRTIR